jgi:hypothetical protein
VPGKHFAGSITRVSYALEHSARTMLAEIDMANPGETLQPGTYLSVELMPSGDERVDRPEVRGP